MPAAGGPPGWRPRKKTKTTRPRPATAPSAIPPRRAPTSMHAKRMASSIQIMVLIVRERLIAIEQFLDLRRRALLQQSQRQQNPRLLRIQLIGGDETHLIVVYFHIPSDLPSCNT